MRKAVPPPVIVLDLVEEEMERARSGESSRMELRQLAHQVWSYCEPRFR